MFMKQKSILLVDDKKLILSSLSRDLASDALKVSLAESGEKALNKINATYFDLVITDLHMPEIDGFQVLEATKRKDAQTMVIILTGVADLESVVNALRLGADDFLQKPCDADELLCRMAKCFAKQDLQRKVTLYENILPVCSYCRKIRDDRQGEFGKGYWYHLEEYFNKTRGMQISPACCPDCFAEQREKMPPNTTKENESQMKSDQEEVPGVINETNPAVPSWTN